MRPLEGKTIAIVEQRMTAELARMLERLGASVHLCPMIRPEFDPDPEKVRELAGLTIDGKIDLIVFQTGIGARALLEAVEKAGLGSEFAAALNRITVMARGPKPVAVLRRAGIKIDLVPDEPTSHGIVEKLRGQELKGKRVAVQLYGDPNEYLRGELEAMGAEVLEIVLYRYIRVADDAQIADLVSALESGRAGVIAFTSSPQVHALFEAAAALGLAQRLRAAMRDKAVVVAVGPVTFRALRESGIDPQILSPGHTMAAMVSALADYFRSRESGARSQ